MSQAAEAANLTGNPPAGEPAGEGSTGSWVDTLPESVREWDEVKNSDSPEKFYEQVSNMRSMIGNSIRIPTEDAGEEARAAFIDKLKVVDGVMMKPQDAEQLNEFISSLPAEERRAAYANLKSDEEVVQPEDAAKQDAMAAEITEGLQRLKSEWGNGFERNVDAAKNAVKVLNEKMGDDRLVDALDKTGAGSHPDMIALFAEIAGMLGEKPVLDSDGGVNQFALTPAEAKERIAEIEANPIFFGSGNPIERQRLVEKRAKYAEVAYPDN